MFLDPFVMFGFGRLFSLPRRTRVDVTLAVNVGGCLIPSGLAVYQCPRVARHGSDALIVLLIVALANVAVCYRVARPVPGLGLAIPALVPPLIGADLLRLKEVVKITPAMASIGGAGTFDGIVLSGLIAALLA